MPSSKPSRYGVDHARTVIQRLLPTGYNTSFMKSRALQHLATEQTNRASQDLDRKSAMQIARILNQEDAKVARAVRHALPQIARAIDEIADSLSAGGRLIYVGTGTSGRIGALDASECPPTFGTRPAQVQYIMAGGPKALGTAVEASEDSSALGRSEMARRKPTKKDVVVGIAASGRTPFTIAAIKFARSRGSRTIALTCNRASPLEHEAHFAIVTEVGPEVIAGSSRMKSGTAQKMVLNMLSTGAMTRLGYVYGNLMVHVRLKNKKLVERGVTILAEAAGLDRDSARTSLRAAGRDVSVALVMQKANVTRSRAVSALRLSLGNVRKAIMLAARTGRYGN
jgi:N-acetylmuramic acid 6-phosphate etherase